MIAYLTCWGLFWFGDIVSRIMNNWMAVFLYPIYNWAMSRSYGVQNKYKIAKGPWHDEPNN